MTVENLAILTIGLEPEVQKIIEDLLANTKVTAIPMDIEKLMGDLEVSPCLVISGYPKEGVSVIELAQMLRMQYQGLPIFLCCQSREGFERKAFIKNGFTDAFLLPMDTMNLRGALSDTLAKVSNGAIRVFRPVKIIDVEPGAKLDFDVSVYLSANQKYVKVSNAGDELDGDRASRMKKANVNNVFVPAEQMPKFYQYSAQRLKSIGKSGKLSVTEKKEKLTEAVRDLISNLFTNEAVGFESGQDLMKDCSEIVKSYIIDDAENEWYARMQQVLGEREGTYSHASNVSTFAALFSMGLAVGKPEDLALAGLLHDIGIAELPAELQFKPYEEMNPDEKKLYHKHPEMSINLVRRRKIVVPEIVSKMILQHHELFNGEGFPNGYFGDRICKEAQVLALADKFDELTALKDGKPTMTPSQAVAFLRSEQAKDPSKIHYNPELLKKLISLFPVGS